MCLGCGARLLSKVVIIVMSIEHDDEGGDEDHDEHYDEGGDEDHDEHGDEGGEDHHDDGGRLAGKVAMIAMRRS